MVLTRHEAFLPTQLRASLLVAIATRSDQPELQGPPPTISNSLSSGASKPIKISDQVKTIRWLPSRLVRLLTVAHRLCALA